MIIAGAGGAAHLPGMLASVTPLPVIGVPVPLAHLDGLDSLLSIVPMPAGVPVATVAVGGARNAGLLAVRILAARDEALRDRMARFQAELREQAQAKGAALRGRGRPGPPRKADGPALRRVAAQGHGHVPWISSLRGTPYHRDMSLDFPAFALSEEHEALREAVRALAETRSRLRAAEIDQPAQFP